MERYYKCGEVGEKFPNSPACSYYRHHGWIGHAIESDRMVIYCSSDRERSSDGMCKQCNRKNA